MFQAFKAAGYVGSLPQLVVSEMDVSRFSAVNTSRGRWALLDQLATTAEGHQLTQTPLPLSSSNEPATALSLADVARVIADVAKGIIGDDLGGKFSSHIT